MTSQEIERIHDMQEKYIGSLARLGFEIPSDKKDLYKVIVQKEYD
jgi:hypothetical protein